MSALLQTPEQAVQWLRARVTGRLCTDSRTVAPGDGFLAWPGAATDARQHVAQALAQGAGACLVEHDGAASFPWSRAPQIACYPQLKAASGPIAAAYYGHPSAQLDVLAITGTNGKTSTAWWLAQALSSLSQPCAVVGTLGIGMPPELVYNGLTTPDPVLLQQQLRVLVGQGVRACAVEASSIGLAERRLDGCQIRLALLTNFSQDHLDYHGSMQAYWQAKEVLFHWPGLRAAVLNIDDRQGQLLHSSLHTQAGLDVWTFSACAPARLQARDIVLSPQGLCFTVHEDGDAGAQQVQTQLIGQYNVLNLLGVIAALRALGWPLDAAAAACAALQPVPGRMQWIQSPEQPLVAIDYAHTPDALAQALQALRPLATQRGGRLWCIFGCGGERDRGKRPLMGAAAQQHADAVLVTSDNPRSESANSIIGDIVQGMAGRPTPVEPDRAQAIASVLASAEACDVVLIAGKGHEDYQEIDGMRRPFSDQLEAQRALQGRGART